MFGRVDDPVEADGGVPEGGGGTDDQQVRQCQRLRAEQMTQGWQVDGSELECECADNGAENAATLVWQAADTLETPKLRSAVSGPPSFGTPAD